MTYCPHFPIDATAMFKKSRQVHSGKWLIVNLVDLLVGFNSRLKRDDGSKARERKNNDTKDHSLDVASTLPLVVMQMLGAFVIHQMVLLF